MAMKHFEIPTNGNEAGSKETGAGIPNFLRQEVCSESGQTTVNKDIGFFNSVYRQRQHTYIR